MDDTRRIDELEIRYTHQERLIEELNAVLIEQGRAIERLIAEVKELRDRAPGESQPQYERPPHY